MTIEVKKDPRYRIRKKFFVAAVKKIFSELGVGKEVSLGVVLAGKRKAKELNQDYRKMDYIPEVLSFPYQEKTPEGKFFLGEVLICFPLVREKAIRENQRIEEAMTELLRHGIKNLLK